MEEPNTKEEQLSDKEAILLILKEYKDMPFLWDKTHVDYTKQNIRAEAYSKLLAIYRRYDSKATMRALKKKIENMRTYYLKEMKKIHISIQNGGEVYVPTIWYYDAISFLESTYEIEHVQVDLEKDIFQPETVSSDGENIESDTSTTLIIGSRARIQPSPILVRKKPKREEKDEEEEQSQSSIKEIETCNRFNRNEWALMGKAIGLQLRDVNDTQASIAQKLISDVIYYANLGRLTEDSHIFTGMINDYDE